MNPKSIQHNQKTSRFRSIIGFGISALLFFFTIQKSGLRVSDIKLNSSQALYFTSAIFVFIFSLWLYSLRAGLIWKGQTNGDKSIQTYRSLLLGNFYNCILPGNLGEGVRAWHFSRKNNKSFSSSLAGIVTEKWLDAQVFAVLIGIYFLFSNPTFNFITYSLFYTAAAIVLMSALHFFMLRNKKLERLLWSWVLRLKVVGRFLYRLYLQTNNHLIRMKKVNANWGFVFYFILIFSLNVIQFYLLEKAAGIEFPVAGFHSAYLVSLSMMIIAFIPSAPGSIGVLHFGVYSVLYYSATEFGVLINSLATQQFALFSIYAHLSFLIPESILGGFVLFIERREIF